MYRFFFQFCFFDSGDLTPVPSSCPQEPSYPLRRHTEVLQQGLNGIKEHEEIHYHIEFQDETKRVVDSFKLRNFFSDKCNQKVEELAAGNKNGLSFEVEPILQLILS